MNLQQMSQPELIDLTLCCFIINTSNHLNYVFFVLAPYKEWTFEEKESENYCEYTPFHLVFVVLIMKWILLPLECFYYAALAMDFNIKLQCCIASAA